MHIIMSSYIKFKSKVSHKSNKTQMTVVVIMYSGSGDHSNGNNDLDPP